MSPTGIPLRLIDPPFNSFVTDLIIEIDYLRKKRLGGSTQPSIFFQIKHIFHVLESIGSARIEGNHTTIAEYIESKIEKPESTEESILEIRNNEKALDFIDEVIDSTEINRAFISELHRIVVDGLKREGSITPGAFRSKVNPVIAGSKHVPPSVEYMTDLMEEFFTFIGKGYSGKYDLIKVAIAHHRFAWIHPFDNGNGRTVRLLTYAMLVKMGFRVRNGRILNPTAVFCSDRDAYYDALAFADTGTDKGLLNWVEYMLKGLKDEIEKIDRLLEYDFMSKHILLPSLKNSHAKRVLNDDEFKIMTVAVNKQAFKTSHLLSVFPKKSSVDKSRAVARLRDRNFLAPVKDGERTYFPNFIGNELMREIIKCLDKEGFLPLNEEV